MADSSSSWSLQCKFKGKSVTVCALPTASWLSVKQQLEDALGIPSGQQKLICRGKQVKDDMTVRDTKGAKDKARIMVLAANSEVRQAEEKRQQKNQNDEKFSNVFRKGEVVLYKGQEDVTVLKAHFDDPTEVYYTIKRSDGTERQTISKYLSRKSAAAESPSPPSLSSSALRKAEGVEESSSKDDNDTKGNDSKSAVAATSGNSSSSSSSFPFHAPPKDTNIKYIVVKHGAKAYYIPCDPDKETVGGIKIRLEEVLGVPKRVIRLVAGRLTKADDDTVLASVRIKHKSKMMVLFKEGFHIARYGEEVLQKAIAQIEAAEQLADSTEKRFEHRGLDLAEGVRRLFSLNDAVSNLHRTLEGVTVKSASEKIVSGLKERLRVLKRRVKEITKARSEFG